MRYRPPRLAGSAAAFAAVAMLAACGSGAHYVANDDEDVYLKLPPGWTALDAPIDGVEAPLPWLVVLDHHGDPAVEHFDEITPTEPVGRILVGAVAPEQRESMSLQYLRSSALGGAYPLTMVDEPDPGVEILGSLNNYEVDGNFGNRIRFTYVTTGGSAVVEQVAIMNPALTRYYVIQMHCERSCFETHLDEIEQIIDSLHIGAS